MIYSKLAMYYDQFIDHDLNNIYITLIKKYFSEGKATDLGCGTAPLAIMLAKNGFFVTASDISESMLERAFNNSLNENVKINFNVHDILDPLNIDSDIITMSSDVINYLDSKVKVIKAFKNIEEVMNENSIYIFDFLKTKYLTNLIGHSEKITLDNSLLIWNVVSTDKELQIRHNITIDGVKEFHIQTTFFEDDYIKMLKQSNLNVVEKVELEDRIIFVCKKNRRHKKTI